VNQTGALDFDTVNNSYSNGIVATLGGASVVTAPGFSWGNGTDRVGQGNSLTIQGAASLIDNGSFDFLNTDGGTSNQAAVTYNLSGGTLAAQNFLLFNYGGNALSIVTLNLNGGSIEALASNGANGSTLFFPATTRLTTNVLAGGVTVNTNGYNVTIGQALLHSGTVTDGGLLVEGAGSLTLTAVNTYSGPTTVNAGSTLVVSGQLSATDAVTVNGTLDVNASNAFGPKAYLTLTAGTMAFLSNETESMSDLLLGAGPSTLSLGATGTVLNFADSSADVWSGTLAITNWNGDGANLNGGGPDQVIFAGDDLTGAQLAAISFINPTVNGVPYSGSFTAVELSSGEIVAAIPEPGTWASLIGGLGMLLVWQRSRSRRQV
jgi:autotransporter-associated beta strand protein